MSDPIAHVTGGAIRGSMAHGVQAFKGVPYARAPTGPLRFRPPERPEPWPGVRDAVSFGRPAMQHPTVLETARGFREPCDEDCLYLNVWAPDDASRRLEKLPVLVWIHGGAFINGAGSIPWYEGSTLAARGDIIVVSLNYRLGPFGFLDLSQFGDDMATSGNVGLLDQIAALEWVSENVGVFGGDPRRICVIGESAGAMSVGTLLTVRAAQGLFQRAILQSGTPTAAPQRDSTEVARQVFGQLGLDWAHAGLSTLRELPSDAILRASAAVSMQRQSSAQAGATGAFVWRPVIDGVTVQCDPTAAIEAGAGSDVPVLIGTTADEMRVLRFLMPDLPEVRRDELVSRLRFVHGDQWASVLAAYEARFPRSTPDDVWSAMLSDRIFGVPTAEFIDARVRASAPTWTYSFEWRSPVLEGRFGAAHTAEIPFVFGTFGAPGAKDFLGAVDPVMRSLSGLMQEAWVSFATHGDPATSGVLAWEPCAPGSASTMLLGGECGMGPDPRCAARTTLSVASAPPSGSTEGPRSVVRSGSEDAR